MWSRTGGLIVKQITVGIRELKGHLSEYVHRVKEGATLVITERGRPVGRIVPIAPSVEERLEQLATANLVAWSGRKLRPSGPVARLRGTKTVAEMLLEDRE
jgi:prevent-host-death family protein